MNQYELVMRRRSVRAFIAADPISLVIKRPGTPVKNAETGGYVKGAEPATLPVQKARIVQNKRRFNNGIINSEAGDIPHTDYLLIGMHTLDVEVNDEFVWQTEHYKVTGIDRPRDESTLCSVDMLGQRNRQEEVPDA